jgi:membrane protein YdbS with pleckstrin-like domain
MFMAYIDELLGGDEKVLYVGRQHLFILVGNIVAELGLIALMIAAGVVSQAAFQGGGPVVSGMSVGQLILFVCLIISALVLASALFDYLRWLSTEYVITNHRVIRVRGLFSKESIDSSLDKINDVELRQTWLGRLFDYGDIEILTASEAMTNVLRKIGHPLDFKRAMLDAKQQYMNGFGYYDPREVAPYVDELPRGNPQHLEETLNALADLRDRGLLSNEEFEIKKAELLKRI